MADEERKLPTDSKIKKSGFNNFMTKLFGFRRTGNKVNDLEFTQVDVDSNQRIGQAYLNELSTPNRPLSEKADKLFNYWLNDNTDTYSELSNRRQRVDQLSYAVLNDPYINQTVQLYADEACQLDEQDTIINIETPDPRMTRDMYNLLNLWGITQTRIRATFENLATYGDAFWANKVTENGIERIIPLQQLQVTDRLEFNPIKVLEMKKRREGALFNFSNKNYLIKQMLDQMEETGDFADLFDTKLFGFSIDSDLVVPPWAVTHFRVGYDLGQFYPFGTSPILGAIVPFKQTMSTIALQALARSMSFPVTLYQVKTSDSMDEGKQFNVVANVKEKFDNIGVTPKVGSSEVYTVNTKIWLPDGLLKVDVVKPDIDINSIGDLKFHQGRTAVATGLPQGFYESWYGIEHSGKSLTQQYKPFARKVYSLQSAFLSGLSDLFRLQFAITGAYDFRTPFTLSMKFPSVEDTEERQNARKSGLELASNVIEIIKAAIGAGEDESLPTDIVRDILGKYTFLDPGDLMKWTRDAKFSMATTPDIENSDSEEISDIGGMSEPEGEAIPESGTEEEISSEPEIEPVAESLRIREKYLLDNYKEKKNKIYFDVLRETAVNNFVRDEQHVVVSSQPDNSMSLMLETIGKESNKSNNRLQESFNSNIGEEQ